MVAQILLSSKDLGIQEELVRALTALSCEENAKILADVRDEPFSSKCVVGLECFLKCSHHARL